jgi:diguanylate cyclase (GGDEF)-like protein/PAS domain S-box-containing protein
MRILKLKSLKTRITLFSLLIFVLGIWLLSFYANHKLQTDMAKQLGDRQLTIAALVAKQINYDLQERFEALQLVADSVGPISLDNPTAVQTLLDNRPLLERDFNAGAYVANLDGTAIASTQSSTQLIGFNYIYRDYLSAAIAQGKWRIGQPVISRVLNSPIIGMAVPIKSANGKIIGAVAGIINLSKSNFLDNVIGSKYGKNGYFVLQDKKSRTIITNTGKSRVMQKQPSPGINALIDRHLKGYDETGITINADGIEVLASSKSVPIADWSAVAVLPTSEAFRPIRELKQHILFSAIVMTLFAGSIIWWMLRRELFPMLQTVNQLAVLSKSDQPPQPLPVTSKDEIGDLIRGFNGLLETMSHQSEELKQSEFRWKFALEGTGDGLWDWNLPKKEVFFSKTWKAMLGYSEEDIGNGLEEWEKRVHPEDKPHVLQILQAHLEGKTPVYSSEHRLLCKTGGYKWILDRGLTVSRDSVGSPLRLIGLHTDITERKLQEEYKDLRNRILEMLASGETMETTLRSIISGIEKMYPEMLCSILLVDCDHKRLVNGIAPSLPNFYLDAINGLPIGIDQAACGTAAFTGERVIVEDISTHPYWTKFKKLAERAGLGACWSQPILSSNHEITGTFAIYHRDSHTPTPTDIKVIEESAQLASIAISKNAAEYDQRIAATAFETSKGMMITDSRNIILRVNNAFTEITGYKTQDVIGKTPKMLSSGHHDKNFYKVMWTSLKKTGTWEGEVWDQRKNGEIYPQYLIINTVKDDTGAISNYVASLEDISASKEASEKIHNLAFYDALTQLPNRRLLMDRLAHALATSARSNNIGALLLLDVDQFKTLNETLGYDVGNLLLKEIGDRLAKCVPEGDTVARIGGDEFVVLLEGLSDKLNEAASVTELIGNKILTSLSNIYQLSEHAHHSTVSIGATLFHNHDEAEEELLKQADIAMYQAKKSGRNALRFFDPRMQEAIAARADMETELRKAIEQKQFQLYYQVQINSAEQPSGAEALIRWKHPERGMISPFHFIPLAEETGMILAIGDWVLDTACAQLKAWQQNPKTRELTLSINVSAKQFNESDFVDKVQTALTRHAIDPAFLKLELTESMLLEGVETMITKMLTLRKIGIGFELDDFGTGYSSLQYLKRLPLNQLKIDQSFVRDLTNDENDQVIIRTIINTAHSLNLKVIAEGVETEDQLKFLQKEGCDHYQGYFFGKPVPMDEFETALQVSSIE